MLPYLRNFFSSFKRTLLVISAAFFLLVIFIFSFRTSPDQQLLTSQAKKRSFSVEVFSTGEVDAEHSITVSSMLKGDQCKLIELIPDGVTVDAGEVIARVDPTPFEDKIEDLKMKIAEQALKVQTMAKNLEREQAQAQYEIESILFEVEAAKLEQHKVKEGDVPLEKAKMRSAMVKAKTKYEELERYGEELKKLGAEEEQFAVGECLQCQRDIEQEKEAYETAKMQYENFIQFVEPSMVSKAEINLKKVISKQKDVESMTAYRLMASEIGLEQARQALKQLRAMLHEAERDLERTVIKAPGPGIIVQRMEFRGGKRRKPMLGDQLMRNQPLLEIPDLRSMIVRTKVREFDLHRIAIGKEAAVEVDAFPGRVFMGKVSHIGALAQFDHTENSREKFFDVTIALSRVDDRVRPGMTSRVTIYSENVQDALTVPAHAVFIKDRKYFCRTATEYGGWEERCVEIAPGNEQWAIITAGLEEGENVLLCGPEA